MECIEEIILDNYALLHKEIANTTEGDSTYHALLTGIAMGDRRTHSAFKRARISEEAGTPAIKHLCEIGIITLEPSKQKSISWIEENRVSDKLHFNNAFIRFWFAFVSPLFKGVKQGEYSEVEERFENRKQEFTDLVFEQLSMELLKKSFQEDPIVEIGSYWDREVEIGILAKTESGKTIMGECKYTNAKLKKNELAKLKEKCTAAGFEPDIYVLVSKRGFSNELKSLKGENLRLYGVKNFKKLLEELSPEEMIQGFSKP